MKNSIGLFMLMLFPTILFAFIENLQYEQTITRGLNYNATLLEHNGRLYVDADGAIEEYNILSSGNLELLSYIPKTYYTKANAKIVGDTLYVTNIPVINNYSVTDIYRIDLSGNEMQLIDIQTIATGDGIYDFEVNNNYFFYTNNWESTGQILDRNTFTQLTSFNTSTSFAVKDNLLFKLSSISSNGYLFIMSLNDIYDITEIGNVYFGEIEDNFTFKFHENHLFLGQNDRLSIIDISDPYNPQCIANIENIPNTPTDNCLTEILVYQNYLILQNQYSSLWIYDISDINNPQYAGMNSTCYSSSSLYKESSLIYNDYLYTASIEMNHILQLDISQLPATTILNSFGQTGHYQYAALKEPYLFFNDCLNDGFCYFNTSEQTPAIDTLDCSISSYCFNDSLIFFLKNNNYTLVIAKYNDDGIEIESTINLGMQYYDIEYN